MSSSRLLPLVLAFALLFSATMRGAPPLNVAPLTRRDITTVGEPAGAAGLDREASIKCPRCRAKR